MDDMPTDVMFHPQATTVGTTVEEGADDAMTLEGFERVFHMPGAPSGTKTPSSDSSDACPVSGVSVDSSDVCPVSGSVILCRFKRIGLTVTSTGQDTMPV